MAEQDKLLFGNLGKLVDSKSHYKLLIFLLNSIEKNYQDEKVKTKLLFKSEANFGYVIMWRSLNNDASIYNDISNNLEIQVPFSDRAYVWIVGVFKGIGGWIIGIIGLIIFLGIAYFLGLIGVEVRKHNMIIIQIKELMSQKINKSDIEALSKVRSKSIFRIAIIIFLIVLFYFLIFKATSLSVFLYSLLILVPVVMGYFGIFFTPSEDIDDYF